MPSDTNANPNPGFETEAGNTGDPMDPIETKNQLWRICTNPIRIGRALVALLVSKPGGQSSILWRSAITAGGRAVKASVCKTEFTIGSIPIWDSKFYRGLV